MYVNNRNSLTEEILDAFVTLVITIVRYWLVRQNIQNNHKTVKRRRSVFSIFSIENVCSPVAVNTKQFSGVA